MAVLTIGILVTSEFSVNGDFPVENYTDPVNDLIYINTGEPVPPEGYAGYLDIISCDIDPTPTSINFRITINEGIPTLRYSTRWAVLMDRNNNTEDNCGCYPQNNVDTMYSLIYDSTTQEWKIERAVYQQFGWDITPTEATWAMTSSWPDGKPQILISVPMYEMPELIPEILPWKTIAECMVTYKGDLAPDTGRYYTPLYFEGRMFIEGVFQPVQVVFQHDPQWGNNMTMISSHEWIANIPMVKGKNTLLFGYPYNHRYTIRFNITNEYSTIKSFTLKFWIRPDNNMIWESGPYSVGPHVTETISITAPIPEGMNINASFQFQSKGNALIEVEVIPTPGSEPLQCNKVTVHTKIVQTQPLGILYVPILLFNGTAGNWSRMHDPVTYADAEEHASKATDFIKGTYPVAEETIDYRISWPPCPINYTEVRMADSRVNLTKVHEKLTNYAYANYPGYTRIVALVPNGPTQWSDTYSSGWRGVMIPDNRKVASVTEGWWATTAHEIGHTFGLWIDFPEDDEEYAKADPGYSAPGYWVNHRDDRDRATCFMGRNPYRDYDIDERWICKPDYTWLLTVLTENDPEVLLVNGVISKNGSVQLGNWYHLPLGVPDIPLGTSGDFTLLFLDQEGAIIGYVGRNLTFSIKDAEPIDVDVTNFAFCVPYVAGTAKIQIKYMGAVVVERQITKNKPSVTLVSPNGDEILNPKKLFTITWNASDADGDALTYIIEYSNNSGLTWTPITVDVHMLSYSWDTRELHPGKSYMVKVIATDGLNVGEDASDKAFSITFREDINTDGKVNIVDIFIVAEAFGSSMEDPRWNPEADIDGDGKVNIVDISTIARKFGKSL